MYPRNTVRNQGMIGAEKEEKENWYTNMGKCQRFPHVFLNILPHVFLKSQNILNNLLNPHRCFRSLNQSDYYLNSIYLNSSKECF